MSAASVSLAELDEQSQASAASVSLADLDKQSSAKATQPLYEPAINPLGPGSVGYQKPQPSIADQFPLGPDIPGDPDTAYPGLYRPLTHTGLARRLTGIPVAPPAGRPPVGDIGGTAEEKLARGDYWTNPRTGQRFPNATVPEDEFALGTDEPILGVEHLAGGLGNIYANFRRAFARPNPHADLGTQLQQIQESRRAGRKLLGGMAETLEGASQAGTVFAPAAVIDAPLATVIGYGTGYVASEAAGAGARKLGAPPEAEELARAVGFFIPSALGVASGLRTGTLETPEGKFSAASILGGRARAGIARTPEAFEIRAGVGGTRFGVGIPRAQGPATPEAAPDPLALDEGTQAIVQYDRATGKIPTPTEPQPITSSQEAGLTNKLSGAQVGAIARTISQLPPEARAAAIEEAHKNLTQWISDNQGKVFVDGQIHLAKTPEQAESLAAQLVNDAIGSHDKAQAEDKARTPTPRAVRAPGAKAASAHDITRAPISGKAAEGMTADTAAVERASEQAHIAPNQQPAIAAKAEAPKESAALAQPPKPVEPAKVAEVGTKNEPQSGRLILQPSDEVIENERLAGQAAPELAAKLSQIAASVPGATFDRLRPQKEMERVDEKVEQAGKPPETVPDYLAAQIAAGTVEAKDQLIAQLREAFPVARVEDNFLEGRKELANYRSANVQVEMANGATAEVQIVPLEQQQIANQAHVHYSKGREAELRGHTAERARQFSKAAQMHDEAMRKFRERNGITASAKPAEPAGSISLRQLDQAPRYAYRMRDVGEQGISAAGHAQAGLSEEQIKGYHEGRESAQNRPQDVVRVDLSKLKPEDFTIQEHPDGRDWVKFKRNIAERELERLPAKEQPAYQRAAKAIQEAGLTNATERNQRKPMEFDGKIFIDFEHPAIGSRIEEKTIPATLTRDVNELKSPLDALRAILAKAKDFKQGIPADAEAKVKALMGDEAGEYLLAEYRPAAESKPSATLEAFHEHGRETRPDSIPRAELEPVQAGEPAQDGGADNAPGPQVRNLSQRPESARTGGRGNEEAELHLESPAGGVDDDSPASFTGNQRIEPVTGSALEKTLFHAGAGSGERRYAAIRAEYSAPSGATPPTVTLSEAARDLLVHIFNFPTFYGVNTRRANVASMAGSLRRAANALSGPEQKVLVTLADALDQAVKDAGQNGINLVLKGAPESTVKEEIFHSMQRGLGQGAISRHLPREAVARLLTHPVGQRFVDSFKGSHYEALPDWQKAAEIAAKLASGDSRATPQERDEWFSEYVQALHEVHGEEKVAAIFDRMYDAAKELYANAKRTTKARRAVQRGPGTGQEELSPPSGSVEAKESRRQPSPDPGIRKDSGGSKDP